MRRRAFLGFAAALALPHIARAQRKIPVIGLLWNDSVKPSPHVAVLLTALGEKGYAVPRDLRVEDRVALEGYGSYSKSAAELVQRKVDLIVTNGATATVAAAKATKDIPIVMITGTDPVALGLVASLSRPGGNVTGIAASNVDLTGKRLELLKELSPGITRIGMILAPNVANPTNRKLAEAAAKKLNLEVHFAEVHSPDELEVRIDELRMAGVGAVNVAAGTMLAVHSSRVVGALANHRMPAIYNNERYTDAGGLLSYTTSIRKSFVRAAVYVDRILKGTRPAELAIEQPGDLELVINLKTARALGLKIPQALLVRADRIID